MYISIPRKMTVKGSLAVIAIDIGSAFSGYAYQFRKDFEKARTKNIYSCFGQMEINRMKEQLQLSC